MRILSHQYLQWQIGQLSAVAGELDPHNFHRLLKALDALENLIDDLSEVLAFSGNKNTALYEKAITAGQKRVSLRTLLEEPSEDDEALEAAVAHLQRAIYALGRALQAKSAVAFPFSMN